MEITSDWHIHTQNSCDSACMTIQELITRAEEEGMADFGISDHIHTPYNLPDLTASRKEWEACTPGDHFHFGVEVSCVSRWEIEQIAAGKHDTPKYGVRQGGPVNGPLAIGLTSEELETHGVEYVIGGAHWPMYVPMEREAVIRDYHRQNMFLATHPLVDIVAHPWWWMGHWQNGDGSYTTGPLLDDFGQIPQSMHQEFAAAVRENGTVVEINLDAMLLSQCYPELFKRQYTEYLKTLESAGVSLSIGSDCHGAHYESDFVKASAMLDEVGINKEALWRLGPGHRPRPGKTLATEQSIPPIFGA
ncbi:MAG: PHP domain-containing protein [Candidatus Latescibacterota bacterium]